MLNNYPADGLMLLLRANPTLLDPAPPDYDTADMDRRLAERRSCLRCGKSATTVIAASTDKGPRWLDLCNADLSWLMNNTNPPMYSWGPPKGAAPTNP